jgi:hypothetical protein
MIIIISLLFLFHQIDHVPLIIISATSGMAAPTLLHPLFVQLISPTSFMQNAKQAVISCKINREGFLRASVHTSMVASWSEKAIGGP